MTIARSSSTAGYSTAELLVAVAVATLVGSLTLPDVTWARRELATRATARRVAATFRDAASQARLRSRSVAVEFGGMPIATRLLVDGDGDGVRRDDITNGVDVELRGWVPLVEQAGQAVVEVGCNCPGIDGEGRMSRGMPGIRFGATGLVSFSPAGTATPGTLYLSAPGGHPAVAVRVLGASGRVRTLEYAQGLGAWVGW